MNGSFVFLSFSLLFLSWMLSSLFLELCILSPKCSHRPHHTAILGAVNRMQTKRLCFAHTPHRHRNIRCNCGSGYNSARIQTDRPAFIYVFFSFYIYYIFWCIQRPTQSLSDFLNLNNIATSAYVYSPLTLPIPNPKLRDSINQTIEEFKALGLLLSHSAITSSPRSLICVAIFFVFLSIFLFFSEFSL